MAYIRRVQAALAANPEKKMQAHQVALASGISVQVFQKVAGEMVRRGHISRIKMKESISGYYWYYLNTEQLRLYRLKEAINGEKSPAEIDMTLDGADVPDRLRFLRMLKEKTVFAEYAALALIIGDYERVLSSGKSKDRKRAMEA